MNARPQVVDQEFLFCLLGLFSEDDFPAVLAGFPARGPRATTGSSCRLLIHAASPKRNFRAIYLAWLRNEFAQSAGNEVEVLLKKILITQLAIARVGQREIAKIVGISIGAVNAIARHVKLPKLPKE